MTEKNKDIKNNKANSNIKYSEYLLKSPESFNLKHIFECGQCFRWNYDEENNRYIGVVSGNVISAEEIISEDEVENENKNNNDFLFKSTFKTNEKLKKFVNEYFNLSLNYDDIKKELLDKNNTDILVKEFKDEKTIEHNIALKEAIDFGFGIRILKQDLWETIVSFIISANNNIPRIKKSIESLSGKYGNKVIFENNIYYTFPTPLELKDVSIEEFRLCGLGFRDKRIYDIVRVFLEDDKAIDINKDRLDIREDLMQYNGIGPKVADCILLFALNRYETYPTDVWVRRVMNDIYFKKKDEKKLSDKEILKFVNKKYGSYAGIAQQYLFYWKRENHD